MKNRKRVDSVCVRINSNKSLINAGDQADLHLNNTTNPQNLQAFIFNHLKQNKKVHRLFKCEGCEKHRTLRKMSKCLILCRECVAGLNEKGIRARSNFINKTVNQFHKKLKAGVL